MEVDSGNFMEEDEVEGKDDEMNNGDVEDVIDGFDDEILENVEFN